MSKNVIIPYHPAFSPLPTTNPFLSTTTYYRAARTPQQNTFVTDERQGLALEFGVEEACGSEFKMMGLYSRFWKRSFAAVDRSQNCAGVSHGRPTYGNRGIFIFSVQLTTSRIGALTRLIHTLLYVMTIHTYIHTYIHWHRMTRMTGPDCVVMCNLINTYIHTYIHTPCINILYSIVFFLQES